MPKQHFNNPHKHRGSVLVSILAVSVFLSISLYSLIVLANANLVRAKDRIYILQAQYAAESGADAAIAIINNSDSTYAGTGASDVQVLDSNEYRATYSVSVAAGASAREKVLTATGKVYAPANAANPNYTRTIEVIAQQSSTSGSFSMLSRNSIIVDSSVKDIKAVDVHANGYITMNKNVTNLIAENITVADKNTSASNCSIGGSGNLVKPASFTHAGQTTTNVITAFNNCISPPGNSSNANFTVSANQNNIAKVASTFIPWSAYMDSTYQNSPTGCTDWTTGSFPRNIPSTGNDKKTHYPNNDSNISSSCGTSGNIQLSNSTSDVYVIKNHTHLRANLCASSACTPTFYNPDTSAGGLKFIFIEGTVNFNGLITAPGSGPIVFVAYGSDPASKASVCPSGGALYLGKGLNTNAPAAYLLAINGLCIEKTKFAVPKALGGVSGKNIYISSNSGTPFDLGFDPAFPVSSIPIDLAWKAVQYRRL